MTLKEKAFMIDLIKRNYRRRNAGLCFDIVLILLGICCLLLTMINESKISENLIGILIVTFIAFIFIGLIHMVSYALSFGLDHETPRGIKKRQLKALEENKKADFEELIHCVPLKEYFEI